MGRAAVRGIWVGLRNLVGWAPLVWRDRDYDYSFLLLLLEFKLRRMGKHMREHAMVVNSEKYAAQMELTAALCRRLATDDYGLGLGCTRLGGAKWANVQHAERLAQQDLAYLGDMLRKHVRYWWD